jgi:hypothetical protein
MVHHGGRGTAPAAVIVPTRAILPSGILIWYPWVPLFPHVPLTLTHIYIPKLTSITFMLVLLLLYLLPSPNKNCA